MMPAEIIERASNGNPQAKTLCWAYLNFCWTVDALYDRDEECSSERVACAVANFIAELTANPFYLANAAPLLAVMQLGVSAWADSEREEMKRAKPFLKAQYHDFLWLVARLTGGWDHMRNLQTSAREYEMAN